jgi:hypothetical protein
MSSSPAEKRSELVNRVKYLESIVEKLSTQISSTAQDSAAPDDPDGYQLGSNLPSQFATLRVDDGGSMYVGNRFWAVLNQGVCIVPSYPLTCPRSSYG